VLLEIARVLKPGGKVCIFDGDYASMTYASDDPATDKATDEKIISALVTNPRVMRRMPQLFREATLQIVTTMEYVVADIGRADFWESSIKSHMTLLPKSGAMTESEVAVWADAMLRRSNEGTFFAASNFYSYVAEKPLR
jgi:ubiquinone/menaquinone biosynthesis C-methylase UbiE